MPVLIGLGLALALAAFARISGFDRDRAFYPVVLIVVASYYVLFAAMAGASAELPVEMLLFLPFAAAAVVGFRAGLWIVAAGLALHGLFDFTRHSLLPGSGVPAWWPGFCMGFDVAAGLVLAALLRLDRRRPADPARARPHDGEAA